MTDFVFLIGRLALELAVIAAVGHGIWIFVAWVFRALRGTRSPDVRQPERCVFCKKRTSSAHDRCDWCGRELCGPLAGELKDLDAVDRQLRRFRDRGALKPRVVDEMLARVERYRDRRLHLEPEPRPAAGAPAQTIRPAAQAATPDRPKAADRQQPAVPRAPQATPARQPASPPPHKQPPAPVGPATTAAGKTLFSPSPAAADTQPPISAGPATHRRHRADRRV